MRRPSSINLAGHGALHTLLLRSTVSELVTRIAAWRPDLCALV